MVSVMWFRRDLRIEDNLALAHAFENAREVVLVFHVNPEQFLDEGSLNQAAFFKSVAHFKREIEKQGLYLHLLYGNIEECFSALKEQCPDWSDIYFNRDEKGYGKRRDEQMKHFFKENQIDFHSYMDHHLHGVNEIRNQSGDFYKVFTPYFKKWKEREKKPPVHVNVRKEKLRKRIIFKEYEQKFEKLLKASMLNIGHDPGTAAAKQHLNAFIEENLKIYDTAREYPQKDKTSHLSPYLRSGELSIREVWARLQDVPDSTGKSTFIQELAWRDFYNMIYARNPNQKEQPIKEEFSNIIWRNDKEQFAKWKEGKTGFPIIDAAMRQLQQQGWMHNRLRMVTASFLTKDLLIDWRWGETYFQQMLIDYDAASNIGGWQWAASTGTDAVPYFRIFNPVTQSEKYDATGEFIRKYVPELRNVKTSHIHAPEKMSREEQSDSKTVIDEDYPNPLVDHSEARKRAIAVYEESR